VEDDWQLVEDDCMHMFEGAEGLESCEYSEWVNYCNGDSEECYAYITFDGELFEGDCSELEEMFGDYMNDDDTNDYDWDCEEDWVYMENQDCMEMFYEVEGLEACTFSMYVDTCTGAEDMYSCMASIVIDGFQHDGSCSELEEMFFNNDQEYDDEFCEEEDWQFVEEDCMDMWEGVDEFTSCYYTMWVDMCNHVDDEESCYAYVTFNGEFFEGSCAELEETFGDYMNDENDDYDDWDGECDWEWIENEDCMEMFSDVEGLDYCTYNMWVDGCTGEPDMESCEASITYHGEDMLGYCSEFEAMFYGDDQEHDNDE